MAYAFGVGGFIIAAFLYAAAALHREYHWQRFHEQLDELIYNLARAGQDAGENESGGT
jgi:hypothetical protein